MVEVYHAVQSRGPVVECELNLQLVFVSFDSVQNKGLVTELQLRQDVGQVRSVVWLLRKCLLAVVRERVVLQILLLRGLLRLDAAKVLRRIWFGLFVGGHADLSVIIFLL